ncbi:MAG: PilZ domain-containing protein [Erythrobacter sp.]
MQTRKSNRQEISLPGQYVSGFGTAGDVTLSDLSPGGCRFESGDSQFALGSELKIYVAGSGPYRATVKWVDAGVVGVTFPTRLTEQQFDSLRQNGGGSGQPSDSQTPMPNRFV